MFAFSFYFGMNRLFMLLPSLLHDKRSGFKVPPKALGLKKMIIAHRGGSWEAPENTLKAFKKALQNGAQFLELDTRITKDGVVIVCHDADF